MMPMASPIPALRASLPRPRLLPRKPLVSTLLYPKPRLMPSQDLSRLYFTSLASKTQVHVGEAAHPGASRLGPAIGLSCSCSDISNREASGTLESSSHLSGASPAELWQEAALCSGAKAWLGRAGTGIRPQPWLLPADCYVSSCSQCVTFWHPGVLMGYGKIWERKTEQPKKQPVLRLAILTSCTRDLSSSPFVAP